MGQTKADPCDRVYRSWAWSNLHWCRRLLSEAIALVPEDEAYRAELARADVLLKAAAGRIKEAG